MTLSPEAVAVLTKVERLLVEKGWTQAVMARDSAGYSVSEDDDRATCFCLYGALWRTAQNQDGLRNSVRDALHDATGGNFVKWNDAPGRTKDEVLALIRRVKGDAS